MSDSAREPLCFVVSAPSGAGKTTLAERVIASVPDLTRTISCTTRPRRNGEEDGRDYSFVSDEEFERLRDDDGFLEWAEVHGNLYGTPRSELERIRDRGHDAVMVIDVQGAESVRRALPEAVTVFILPPSRQSLEARLKGRDGQDETARADIEERLGVAAHEIRQYVGYDYLVVNDDLEAAASDLLGIIRAERARRPRRAACAEAIMASFLQPETVGEARDENETPFESEER